jgi:hypothetical protein
MTTGTYETVEIGFEKVLGDPTRAASQTPEDLLTLDAQFLANQIQMEIEKRVATTLFVTGVWGTSNTLVGVDQWSDFQNSDPIANAQTAIRTIQRNTGAKPNVLFLGRLGWEKLSEHPLLLDKYKHTQVGILTPQLVAAAMGIQEIVVGESVENTAAEGASFVGADIWTDNGLFVVSNNQSLGVANGAYTMFWNERGNVPWAMETYRDDTIRAEVSRVFTHLAVELTSAQHGYMFLDLAA